MEIVQGRITGVTPEGLTVFVPYRNTERYIQRAYDQVQVGLPDGRTISPEQRRKAYALLREIAQWSGDYLERVKASTKHDFMRDHLQGLCRELFSLSSCDMTTAREYIDYLTELVFFFGTLKSECLYRVRYSTRAEVEELIAQYIHFYNFERIHLKNGLTSYKIRSKAV